jgi:phage terminase small subunit
MPQSAEASAESPRHVHLPHRQEAFARHVAAGRTLTDAARLAGYAWDSARQTGSRLMKEPQIAARVAGIAHAKEDQRQGELDELVAGLKRVMIDAMERKNDFATLRAIDMIARLRGLTPTTAKRSGGVETALEEMHRLSAEDEETAGAETGPEAEPVPALPDPPETVFDPPMPPELPQPVEPAPAPASDRLSPAQARAAAQQAARAEAARRIFRYEHLMAHHPELSPRIEELSDARAYFDDSDTLLPPELWPEQAQPSIAEC